MKLVMKTQAKIEAMPISLPLERGIRVRETNREQTPDTDDTVHRDGTDGIVDLQLVERDDGRNNQQAADGADQRGDNRRGRQRLGRDRHEASQRAVQCHRQVGLAEPEARQYQREHETTGCRHIRVHEDQRDGVGLTDVGHLEFRATVETEPAEPQDQGTERGERQVAARNGIDLTAFAVLAFARPEKQDAGQCRRSAAQVHDARASEIEEAGLRPGSRRPISRSPARDK